MIKRNPKGQFVKGNIPWSYKGGQIIKLCLTCKEEYLVYPYRNNSAQFCSGKCRRHSKESKEKMRETKIGCIPWNKNLKGWTNSSSFKNKEKHPNWLGGISFEPYSVDWTETLRKSIRERDKFICQLCKIIPTNRVPSVHHIDYDKKNCNPLNLITLCCKCNNKANFNRNYWTDFFQVLRIRVLAQEIINLTQRSEF